MHWPSQSLVARAGDFSLTASLRFNGALDVDFPDFHRAHVVAYCAFFLCVCSYAPIIPSEKACHVSWTAWSRRSCGIFECQPKLVFYPRIHFMLHLCAFLLIVEGLPRTFSVAEITLFVRLPDSMMFKRFLHHVQHVACCLACRRVVVPKDGYIEAATIKTKCSTQFDDCPPTGFKCRCVEETWQGRCIWVSSLGAWRSRPRPFERAHPALGDPE